MCQYYLYLFDSVVFHKERGRRGRKEGRKEGKEERVGSMRRRVCVLVLLLVGVRKDG